MAINSVGQNLATNGEVNANKKVENKGILGKDDFMKLLLVQLQHQDPTEPMDSQTILTQTSQLATLEASANTNKALASLAASLKSSQNFSSVAAIGKTADLGSNAIGHKKSSTSTFEVYFPQEIKVGTVEILDSKGKIIATMPIDMKDKDGKVLDKKASGVYKFDWDGKLKSGAAAESGIYYVTVSYKNPKGEAQTTRLGTYPITAVRFENGDVQVKLGSNYVPLNKIKEIY
ncbi:flagellar hook capping FlgD N-terminal domain-containing protein [Sulfurimonas sp.]|uniref:flagellar hook capping FlgD N-terminal domain-containing protein n=1 Tax=Sulfurimonas sp. TaxID=2022749 RepID=UPI002AB29343|nr:flagellar hook capping FlgD N-terminal domain-containing protein [Sulfurimonas sp.]